MSNQLRVLAVRLFIFCGIAALLEVAPRAGWISKLALVPLSEMLRDLWTMLGEAPVWQDLGVTVARVASAFIAAAALGVFFGYLLWRRPRLYRLLSPYFGSYYSMPVFAFYPVLIAIFGLSSLPMILIGFGWAVIAVIDSTVTGFRNIPLTFHNTVRMYRLSRRAAMFRVYIPSAAGTVFGGFKLAASYAMIGVIASEFVLSSSGLGHRVAFDFQSFDIGSMYATILLLIIFEISVIALLGWGERRIAAHRAVQS